LVPSQWEMYSETMVCTHGQPYRGGGKGKRKHSRVRGLECPARANARVTSTIAGTWKLRVYAENRTVKDLGLSRDVAVLHKAGATVKGTCANKPVCTLKECCYIDASFNCCTSSVSWIRSHTHPRSRLRSGRHR
ncbi:hypothetical protein PHMEG_00041802, partial [Phytophthora megakarya]